ncbi:MAG: phosphatidate cytidylyltransferase [Spirochaetia bacterium]|jgi:dolichol kinase
MTWTVVNSMKQSQIIVRTLVPEPVSVAALFSRFQGEIVRKSLHFLIALVPMLAAVNVSATLGLLAAGTLFYAFAESSRLRGFPIPLVSDLTMIASREIDRPGFVLGPVTLGLGAMLSLLLYPLPAASIAIYALAFGDGIASLAGTMVRGTRIPLCGDKTISGSLACFAAVFVVTLSVTRRPVISFILAMAGALLEAIPAGNFDNIILPVGIGLIASRLPLV